VIEKMYLISYKPPMDLYELNFKRVLCVLTTKEMRGNILKIVAKNEIDVNIKFADSYFAAATLINENEFEPYDHVILNLSLNNRKLDDFVEFLHTKMEQQPNFLIEYTRAGNLDAVHITLEDD
jgi:hypothetical protein